MQQAERDEITDRDAEINLALVLHGSWSEDGFFVRLKMPFKRRPSFISEIDFVLLTIGMIHLMRSSRRGSWDGSDDGLKESRDQRFGLFLAGKENTSWMYSEKESSHLRFRHL
jgi:hypothetical protein